MTFEDIKFKVGIIQFENLQLNVDKTAIEANPSTHKIAEWIYNNFVPLEAEVKVNFAEEEKIILQSLLRLKILEVQDEIDRDIFLTLDQEFFCEIKIKKLQELLSKISA